MKINVLMLATCLVLLIRTQGQRLRPGFDKEEYTEILKVASQFGDSAYRAALPKPSQYRLHFESEVVGLDNRWALWMRQDGVPLIAIRGTTLANVSWLENFYAAMAPAKGAFRLSAKKTFVYELADHPAAAVHTGWLTGMAFLSETIVPAIDSLFRTGAREILIEGTSQGGAIAYLLTAYLRHLQKKALLSPEIRFKTYCTAAPKPGNLYFAYDYEALTQEGWSYTIINSIDWVPQSPLSIQTFQDFNQVNPFVHAKKFIRKQKWPKRWALHYAYGRLRKPGEKAAKNYRKFLGTYVAKSVKKQLEGFEPPAYYPSFDYARAGASILLVPDEGYYKKFAQDPARIFVNHLHPAYLYLINLHSGAAGIITSKVPAVEGSWELHDLPGSEDALHALFPVKKPVIQFDAVKTTLKGTTGCNTFSGSFQQEGNTIRMGDTLAMTRMFCPGEGESRFLEALKNITAFRIEGDQLTLLGGEVVRMRLVRK